MSSFGFTGTNAHVLIEEAPQPVTTQDATPAAESDARPVDVLPLSARSPEALLALAQRYGEWLHAHPDADIGDLCFTVGAGRAHFEHRAALVVDSVRSAREALADLADNRTGRELRAASAPTRRRRRGCSPDRAANTRGWRASCSTPSRFSPRR